MRRFAKAAFLRTAAASRHVLDGPFVLPTPVSDVLLQDLSWSTVASLFTDPDGRSLIHQPAPVTDDGKFAISPPPSLRACALLPVTKILGQQRATHWAPFVIVTGAAATFFTKKTVDELGLDFADDVEVFGQRINLRHSAGHFDDINVLGTDVLSCGTLLVDYDAPRASFQRTAPLPGHWVQQRNPDGKHIGQAFKVTPTDRTVDALKTAIMARMDVPREGGEGADLTIYEPKSIVPILNAARTLETNAEWAPYGFVVHRA